MAVTLDPLQDLKKKIEDFDFEKQKSSFLLWIDYTILEYKNNITSVTSEIILNKDGKTIHIKTIKN